MQQNTPWSGLLSSFFFGALAKYFSVKDG